MGYLNNSGLARFWNAIKSKFIRTINGIGPDTNGNVSVDTCEFINGTQTAATGSFTGISRDSSLYDGKHIIYRLPYAGSGNATLNLTLADGTTTGAKNVWRSPGTRLTTHYAAGNFLGMTYFQSDDSWHCDVDVDTDSYAYGVRLYYSIYKVKTALYRYQIVLTRDEDTLLPVNAVDNVGTTKQLTTDEFDPFGEIYWYWTTTVINAGSYIAGSNLLSQYWLVDLRYSFNTGTTLTAYKDVYLVCEPRPNGKAVLAPNPISQTLPSSEDGYVYIRLGKAYDTYRITLDLHKPRYYYANGEIREWTNAPVDAKLAEYNTDEDVFQIRHAKAEKPSYNSEVIRKITGGTLAWNQIYTHSGNRSGSSQNVTITDNEDGSFTLNGTATANGNFVFNSTYEIPLPKMHVFYVCGYKAGTGGTNNYLGFAGLQIDKGVGGLWKNTTNYDALGVRVDFSSGTVYDNVIIKPQIYDLTAMFGSTIADRIYALEQATAGAGVAWFRRYFNRDYYEPAQTLANTYFDEYETTGFNLWDEQWDVGSIDGGTGAYISGIYLRSKNKIRVVSGAMYYLKKPNSMNAWLYFYDANGVFVPWGSAGYMLLNHTTRAFTVPDGCAYVVFLMDSSYGTTYKNDICINLSDASRNGQYEPYRYSRITFFDNPVLLRGIPYLDENDNLRFNGDTLEANRKIDRRYTVVDLGTLNWTYKSTDPKYFYCMKTDAKRCGRNVVPTILCNKYTAVKYNDLAAGADKVISRFFAYQDGFNIADSSYTDAATFKAAMSGVYLVYELETPIEEEFTPIDGPLVSDPLGLEIISKSDWDDTPTLAQMDILYANEARANVEMIATNKIIASQNSAKDLSKCITVKPGKTLANGTDLNTVKTFGEYYLWVPGTLNTYTNAAFIGNSKLLVIDMQGSDYDDPMYNGGVMQIQIGEIYDSAAGVRTNKAYSRIYYSGTTWSSWKPLQGGSGVFYGSCPTAAATTEKAVECPEFTATDLIPGSIVSVKFENTNSGAVGSLQLNVNGTGAYNIKYVYNGTYSNIPGANYIKANQLYLFTFDGTYWVLQMMYNTNSAPGMYYYGKKTYTVLNPYMLCLTRDNEYVLPVNTENTTATTKTITSEPFDPFGEIYYYAGSSAVSAGSNAFAGNAYTHYSLGSVLDLRYSFNTGTTLTARKDVYLVCQPQFSSGKPTGKVKLYTPYVTQTIPVTDQSNPVMGLIYIKIGNAYDTYRIQLDPQKPIYYYDGANIVPWHGFETLQSTDITIANGDKLVVTDASDNDKVARTSIAFDGSTTTQVLSKKGTWVTLPSQQTVPEAATATPLPPTTNGAVGTATKYAREDHVHPSDPTKASSTHTHGNITNAGALQTTDITIANGDKLVVTDSSDSSKVARTSIAFDGSTTTQVLSKKGTWVSLPSTPTAAGVTDVPQPDAAIGDAGTSTKYARADHVHPTSVHGIPSGGTTGQFLTKSSNTDYDVAWVTVTNANGVSF